MPEGREGVQELPEPTEGTEDVSVDITDTTSEPEEVSDSTDEEPSTETARETVARILRESQKKDTGDTNQPKAKEAKPVEVKKTAVKQIKEASKEGPFNIPAPARLTVEQKELFHQLPDALKRATHKMFQDWEAQYTKVVQGSTKAEKEAAHVVEAVRPYLLSHPELAEQGYTESKLVAALVAAHQRLTDPKTSKQTWLALGAQVGVPKEVLDTLQEKVGSGATSDFDISQHPQFVALREQLNKVTSKLDGAEKEQFNSTVQSIVSEMEAVREEKDAVGKYLYPKLHDDSFLQQVKPLVSALVATIPGLSYGDALKRAYQTVEGNGNSTQVNQARFPASNNEQLMRAQQAAVSVRGRSAPTSASGSMIDIPKEALGSARDSVRWALNQLRRGT